MLKYFSSAVHPWRCRGSWFSSCWIKPLKEMFLFQADVREKKTLITAVELLDYVSDAVNGFVFLLYWEIPIKAQPWNPRWIFGNRLGGCSVGARADLCVSFSSQSLKGQTCGILSVSCNGCFGVERGKEGTALKYPECDAKVTLALERRVSSLGGDRVQKLQVEGCRNY